MILTNWLRRFRAGSPLCRFDPKSWNRVANVLESIEGVGCRIAKTENGWGWQIIVGDGGYHQKTAGGGNLAEFLARFFLVILLSEWGTSQVGCVPRWSIRAR